MVFALDAAGNALGCLICDPKGKTAFRSYPGSITGVGMGCEVCLIYTAFLELTVLPSVND
jgi:hypothetical protein